MTVYPLPRKHARTLALSLVFLTTCMTSCSSGTGDSAPLSRYDGSPVSEYDPEFELDPDKRREAAERAPNVNAEEALYDEGIDAFDRGLYTLAKETFTRLQQQYPASYYSTMAELKIADSLFKLGS